MNSIGDYLIIYGIAFVFGSLITIGIICAAVMPKRRDRIQLQQKHLLALIAEKLGVEKEEIEKVMNYDKNKNYTVSMSDGVPLKLMPKNYLITTQNSK